MTIGTNQKSISKEQTQELLGLLPLILFTNLVEQSLHIIATVRFSFTIIQQNHTMPLEDLEEF
jgi:hypothetical protein